MDDESAVGRGVNNIWGRGFSRPRMWQQYGDNYRGVCMIFDRAALQRALRHLYRQVHGFRWDQ
jgi:hypothetical protein